MIDHRQMFAQLMQQDRENMRQRIKESDEQNKKIAKIVATAVTGGAAGAAGGAGAGAAAGGAGGGGGAAGGAGSNGSASGGGGIMDMALNSVFNSGIVTQPSPDESTLNMLESSAGQQPQMQRSDPAPQGVLSPMGQYVSDEFKRQGQELAGQYNDVRQGLLGIGNGLKTGWQKLTGTYVDPDRGMYSPAVLPGQADPGYSPAQMQNPQWMQGMGFQQMRPDPTPTLSKLKRGEIATNPFAKREEEMLNISRYW